jgi:hypothetical protein
MVQIKFVPGTLSIHKMQNFPVRILVLKSVNLEYNKLVCLFVGTNDAATKRLMFQAFFFHNFLQNVLEKLFQFISLYF